MPVPSPRSSPVTRAHDVRRLRDLLRAAICGGRVPDGRLPGVGELMVGYGVTRSTVREALDLLAAEGLLRGSPVSAAHDVAGPAVVPFRSGPPESPWLPDPPRPADGDGPCGPPFVRAVGACDEPVGTRVLDRSGVAAPGPLAAWLGVAPGSPCLRIEFLSLQRGMPCAVETHHVVHPEAGDLLGIPMRGSWETLLDDAGLRRGRTDRRHGRIPADPALAELLDVAPGAGLVAVEQTTRDPAGRVVDGAVLRIRADAPRPDVPRAGVLRPVCG